MEPCAPGTEDDSIVAKLNKKECEKERVLKQKTVLRNGKYDNIFELTYANGNEHWFCNVCECLVMGHIYLHEIGKRHVQSLGRCKNLAKKRIKEQVEELFHPVPEIAPGEPVPPGFEEVITRVAHIQERLDGFKVDALIGLEYLLELQDYDPSKEPLYICLLCDKRGDPRTVLTHLVSYNHIAQYLMRHFITCYRALGPYKTKEYRRNWQNTLQKIAEAIEKKFGRLKPLPVEKEKFEKDRSHYSTQIWNGKHFSEIEGCTFLELVVHKELTKVEDETSTSSALPTQRSLKKKSPSPPVVACPSKKAKGNAQTNPKQRPGSRDSTSQQSKNQNKRRASLSSVSSISSSDLSDDETIRNKNTASKSRQKGRHYERSRSPSPTRKLSRDGRQMPWHNPNYQKQKIEFSEKKVTEMENERIRKLEEFRKLSQAIENDMQKTLKQHEKNPEKHPHYNEEWKKFWNKRYKELQAQRVDVSKHDFKPEWIQFWNKKMNELHNEELQSKKEALKKRLDITDEPAPIKFKIGASSEKVSPKENRPILPMAAQPDQDNEVIIIDDKEEDVKSVNHLRGSWKQVMPPQSQSSPRSRSSSPIRIKSISKERSPRRVEKDSRRERERPQRSISRERVLERSSRSRERDIKESRNRSHSRERSYSREKSWDKREVEKKKVTYRESSYERDIRVRERIRTVADLPWEREKAYRQYEDYYKPPPIMRDVTRKPLMIPTGPMLPIVPPEDDDENEVNVVAVLRLLTALEDRLGSLGPKVLDLLAQALAMEKKETNSSETLLDNDLNCVLFETTKEKLKGQLLAGLVDIVQERAFKKTIKKTATLIHMASQRKRQRERLLPKVNPLTVPGIGVVDKAAIAKQIANALILQGKTDVTQAELEQLINAVVGMAEASKNSNKPITTATFLQQLTGGNISTVESNEKPKEAMESESKKEKEPEPVKEKEPEPVKEKEPEPVKEKEPEPKKAMEDEPQKEKEPESKKARESELNVEKQPEPEEKIMTPVSYIKTEGTELEELAQPLTPSPGKNSISNMENLSDSDLQTLLQNFKDLSTDEQHNLINYLKKLEAREPERVETLRQFVNLDPNLKVKDEDGENSNEDKSKLETGRESPFSSRVGGVNPTVDDVIEIENPRDEKLEEKTEEKEKAAGKIHLDSEDEDYTFEDVVKTVSKNVKDKELEHNMKMVEESIKLDTSKMKRDTDLSDAKSIISNLMSSFNKNNSNSIDLLGLGVSSTNSAISTSNVLTSTADFAKTLSDINIANLASIVNNVKKLNSGKRNEKPLNFGLPESTGGKLNIDPSQLVKPQLPNLMMTGNDIGSNQNYVDKQGNKSIERSVPAMGFGGPIRGPGGPFRGPINMDSGMHYDGPESLSRDSRQPFGAGRDIGPMRDVGPVGSYAPIRDVGPRGEFGPMRDVGPVRDVGPMRDIAPMRGVGPTRDVGQMRDVGPMRDVDPLRDIGQRDMGFVGPGMGPSGVGPRDIPLVQYPRNHTSYGSNYGNSYPQQHQYANRGPHHGVFDQMGFENDNSQFRGNFGNQFSNRPGGGGYNRW